MKLIERINGLLEKATPGQWHADVYGHIMALGGTTNVASTWTTPDSNYPKGRPWKENAALIAQLRNAAPALMDAIMAAKEWRDATDAPRTMETTLNGAYETRRVKAEEALRSKLAALEEL